ncbi:MAG: hypothetical protein A2418_00285 [Candidatus Brennerbacteria bacterium RIFOXYC1_FULL_41_11]|nr:MAG: hypothetical protein A2418_00285 [Candidatus Brennerbacteria bacterium RIFOXYC1_FULL_41_11]
MQLRIPFTKDKYLGKNFFLILGSIGLSGCFFVLGVVFSLYRFNLINSILSDQNISDVLIRGVFNFEQPESTRGADFSLFWDSWAAVQEHYLDRSNLDHQKMVYGAIKGMLESLEDPYTSFFEPQARQEFEEEVSGRFEGIGIEIGMRDEALTVIAPLDGSPAQKSGLRSGDKILEVDGLVTAGMSLEEAVKKIRGAKDTKVVLTVSRNGIKESQKIEITRGVISVPSVTFNKIGDDIAHIKVHNFYAPVSFEFKKAILEMSLSGRKNIILDLRNNPGGYFDMAVELASWFLEPGSVVVKQDNGNGAFVCDTCKSTGLGLLKNYKLVILVNEGSASASEILAGALRDNKGTKLIGIQTFGKGVVQEVFPMQKDSSIKITVSKWLTPNDHDIGSVGLKPDIEVKDSEELDKDPQLDKAIEIIKSL